MSEAFPGFAGEPRCVYCSRHVWRDLLEWDHVVPTSRGGVDMKFNKIPSCGTCNRLKGARLPFVEWEPPCPLPGLREYLAHSLSPFSPELGRSVAPAPCADCGTIISTTYLKAPRVAAGLTMCICHRPDDAVAEKLAADSVRAARQKEQRRLDREARAVALISCQCGRPVPWNRRGRLPRFCSEACRRDAQPDPLGAGR